MLVLLLLLISRLINQSGLRISHSEVFSFGHIEDDIVVFLNKLCINPPRVIFTEKTHYIFFDKSVQGNASNTVPLNIYQLVTPSLIYSIYWLLFTEDTPGWLSDHFRSINHLPPVQPPPPAHLPAYIYWIKG